MEKWRIRMIHLGYFGFILSLIVFMSIGCGSSGSSGSGAVTTGGSGTTNPAKINDDTSAAAIGASIAFNTAGDAMAVWLTSDISNEHRLLYSFYTQATDTWSNEAELGTTTNNPAVCSDGTDFMVVWANQDIIAREYIVSSATWGAEITIDSRLNWAYSPHVASNGTGYCVAWTQSDGSNTRVYTNVYNGTIWLGAATVSSDTGTANPPRVASNGSGYCVTWSRNDGATNNIYASIYTAAWSAETTLDALAGYPDNPQIASDGAGYCVTWRQDDGALDSIFARIYSGGWLAVTAIESGGTNNAYNPKIASDGTGYGVVWQQSDGGIDDRIFGNRYDNSGPGWSGDGIIDSGVGSGSSPDVAGSSSGYGVFWSQYDGGAYNILANTYDRVTGTWGTETPLESSPEDANFPRCATDGTGYGVVWIQDEGARDTVYANINSGSGWGTETNLMQNQYHASVLNSIRFAANTAGDVLAIWRQYDKDRDWLFGRLYSGGAWGGIFEIVSTLNYYDVSSDGVGFMIVYNRYGRINAVPYDTTTGLGAETQISDGGTNYCRISSNGAGYCATWLQSIAPNWRTYANIYNGSWQLPADLTPLDSGSGHSEYPQVASNGTGYCVTWNQDGGGGDYDIWARIHDGSSWDPAAVLVESDSNHAWYAQVSSDGIGYCVIWEQNNNIYANVYESFPLAWSGANLVETGSGWVVEPQVASNGSSYGVTWTQYDGVASIYVHIYAGSWVAGAEQTIESGTGIAYYPRIASNGTGYCVSWVQDDGTADSAYANTFDGSTWGTAQVLESSDTEVSSDWNHRINVVAVQDTYTIGWVQEDVNDSLLNNVWAYSGLSD